jgi:dTDP-4-amino-4,6-dideoxygalactose transaminase
LPRVYLMNNFKSSNYVYNLKIMKKIYLSSPHMSGGEMKYINEAFEQNWVAPLGPNVVDLEAAIARYCGVKDAAVLNSGTAAIHLALIMLGVEKGDEVIASTFTFCATVNPIVYQGALPILIDSEPGTWNMDPFLLEKAIKDRLLRGKKPKAIIPVHLYGMPANMTKIMEVADRYEIPVISDTAEALGSRYLGKPAASYGKMAVISFNGNKIITTSGGGALLSDNEEYTIKARFLASQAKDKAPYYQHSQIGYNYRMSNILAGIGLGQLEVIEDRVKARRYNHFYYKETLSKYDGITFLEEPDSSYFSNHWLTAMVVDPAKSGKTVCTLQKELEEVNIESRLLWKPMHLQPVFSHCPAYLNGTSEQLFKQGFCLPSGSNLSQEDLESVVNTLSKSLKKITPAQKRHTSIFEPVRMLANIRAVL